MPSRNLALALAAALVSVACDQSVTRIEPTPTDQTIITEILTGTVAPAVNGVAQSTFKTYVVGQGGGPVTVTFTSSILTRPDGSTQGSIPMGLGAGTLFNGVCVVPATSYIATQPGTIAQLTGSLGVGTYCIQLSDITSQVGPVAFSVTVTHP